MVRRVSVVGNSGVGKSTLARRLAAELAAPYVELDAINHLRGWKPIHPDAFAARVDAITTGGRWVIDGNYRSIVVEGPVWRRADTVVWLDLPRAAVMRRVIARSLHRVVKREKLWNGNRESLRNLLSWNPDRSIIRWSWTQHAKYVERFSAAMRSPALAHLHFVRLTSDEEVERWLSSVCARRSIRRPA